MVIVVGCTILMGFLLLPGLTQANPRHSTDVTSANNLMQIGVVPETFELDNHAAYLMGIPVANGWCEETPGRPSLVLATNTALIWTTQICGGAGDVVSANGSVMGLTDASLRAAIQALGDATNRSAIP
jgi:hypothetical protein